MRSSVCSAAVAVALAATAVAAPPASAAVVAVLTCSVHYDVYGAGYSTGSGDCAATGSVNGHVTLTFEVYADRALCPAREIAAGSMSGALNADFNWSRIGHLGVVTTTHPTGQGTAKFFVTEPVGNPCGGPATTTVVMHLRAV